MGKTFVITIRREGGHTTESWTFDGWFLMQVYDLRAALIFNGSDLLDYGPEIGSLKRWQFDGRQITLFPDKEPLWQLEGGRLHRPTIPGARGWRFDGQILEDDTHLRPDRWIASGETPILVMTYVAGLLETDWKERQ